MYSSFKFDNIPLKDIALDERNPRIVTQEKLSSQNEILKYLFEHEDLESFIKKVVSEGKNLGAERPYVIQAGNNKKEAKSTVAPQYMVVEGNTRIAAYKVLTGLLHLPKGYTISIPNVSESFKNSLLMVDCSVAPNRDALLPIIARAHFGLGDKSRWSYLGSRKVVYEEWRSGKTLSQLAKVFDCKQSEARNFILEYELYLEALKFSWTKKEKEILLNPSVEFNPPVRFLQTSGHKAKIGMDYDTANIAILFKDEEEICTKTLKLTGLFVQKN